MAWKTNASIRPFQYRAVSEIMNLDLKQTRANRFTCAFRGIPSARWRQEVEEIFSRAHTKNIVVISTKNIPVP